MLKMQLKPLKKRLSYINEYLKRNKKRKCYKELKSKINYENKDNNA